MTSHLSTSPELSNFYDTLVQSPVDVDSLLEAVKHISDPEERNRALEHINAAQAISQEDRSTLRNALVETSQTRPQARPGSTRPEARPETLDSSSENISGSPSKLADIGKTLQDANDLFEETEGKEPTSENIRNFQENHKISEDGEMGIETYGEMIAEELVESGLDPLTENTLQEILNWFEYANLNSVNAMLLRALLETRKDELENTENYDTMYKDFFDKVEEIGTISNESEAGQAAQAQVEEELHRPDADGRSTVMRIKNGIDNGNLGEEISSLIEDKGPMIIFLLAGAFVFGMIPGVNNSVATNTWWKRLLIGGVALMNKDNITDLANITIDGTSNFFNNPRTRERFDSAREKTSEVISDMVENAQGIDIDPNSIDASYEAITNTLIGRQETLLNDEGEPRIPNEIFMQMHTSIMSDEKFLNASTLDVLAITTYEGLKSYLTPETIASIGFEENDTNNEYINLYIQEILKPEVNTTHDFVGDMFISSTILGAASETIVYNTDNLTKIDSPEQRTLLEQEFSNILNLSTTSAALKDATEDLLLSARDGDVSDFIIDNYPSLSSDTEDGGEKGILQKLQDNLSFIFETQNTIAIAVSEIKNITLNTREGQLSETKTTLQDKLGSILSTLSNNKEDLGNTENDNINAESFNWQSVQDAYDAKRLEIIGHAGELGITQLTENGEDINVMSLVHELEISSISNSIEVPDTSSTPLELQKWWNDNEPKFTQLETIASELSDDQTDLQAQVEDALEKRDNFIEVYKTVREIIKTDLDALNTQISAISIENTDLESYRQARTTLEAISREYDTTIAKVIPSWGATISTDIWTYFKGFLDNETSAFMPDENNNSIEYLDSELLEASDAIDISAVERAIADTIRNLESGLQVSLDISSIDVTNTATLSIFKTSVREANEILGFVLDQDIKDGLESQLATQVTQVEELFITAIAAEDITEQEIRALRNIYNTEFKGFLNSNGNGNIREALRDMWNRGDRVEIALQERMNLFEKAEIYNSIIANNNDLIKPIIDLLNTFYTQNESNDTITNILDNLGQDQQLTVKGLLEVLDEYITEGNVLYIENEEDRTLISSLIEAVNTEINTIN